MLINEIILEQAKPLKDGDKVSLHNVEFIYDQPTNSFKRKADGVTVNTGSEAHALLMGLKGFQPDGKSPLQPGTWDSIKKAVSTAMGGPLGQASRMDPKASILGKILGTAGDAVSRLLKKGMVSYQKNKQSKIDQIDQTNKDRMQGQGFTSDSIEKVRPSVERAIAKGTIPKDPTQLGKALAKKFPALWKNTANKKEVLDALLGPEDETTPPNNPL